MAGVDRSVDVGRLRIRLIGTDVVIYALTLDEKDWKYVCSIKWNDWWSAIANLHVLRGGKK